MILLKSSFMIILFFAVLAVAYMVMYNKNIFEEDEKKRKIILIGIFIIINLISFNFNYIEGTRLSQTPDYLIGGASNILVPIFINLLSVGAFYILDKEKEEMGIMWKLIFLLVLDSFIANLIYTPFIMINKIII